MSRRAEAQAVGGGLLHGLDDGRVRVAVDHRAVGTDQVNVLVAVHVPQAGALAAGDDAGLAAHGAEGADRGVHTTRDGLDGALEPLLGLGCLCRRSHARHCNGWDPKPKLDIPRRSLRSPSNCANTS